jgi:hypothetical protein
MKYYQSLTILEKFYEETWPGWSRNGGGHDVEAVALRAAEVISIHLKDVGVGRAGTDTGDQVFVNFMEQLHQRHAGVTGWGGYIDKTLVGG